MSTPVLKAAVADYFSGHEWSLSFEVGDNTGWDTKRHIDAVAMNLWPSRGLALHGIEMKVSRGDWQKELANPAKAEEIHRYCDFWWLAATRGVVKDAQEIPIGWGFLEMTEGGTLRMKRQAAKQERPIDLRRGFVAGMLRARERADSHEFTQAVNAEAERRVAKYVESRSAARILDDTKATVRLAKLTSVCGEAGMGWLTDDDICRAVGFVLRSRTASGYSGILGLIEKFEAAEHAARRAATDLRDAAAVYGIDMLSEKITGR
jgi:hypothetical protein